MFCCFRYLLSAFGQRYWSAGLGFHCLMFIYPNGAILRDAIQSICSERWLRFDLHFAFKRNRRLLDYKRFNAVHRQRRSS
jgi:hypothetical protein